MTHSIIINEKPKLTGCSSIPDGALCGNGDLSVILGNYENGMRVFLGKCDCWKSDSDEGSDGGIKPVGYIDIPVPAEAYADYRVEQRMDTGVLFCRFGEVRFEIRVLSDKNCVVVEALSDHAFNPAFVMKKYGANAEPLCEERGGITLHSREYKGEGLSFDLKIEAASRTIANLFLCEIKTSFDEYEGFYIADFDKKKVEIEKEKQLAWWKGFWEKSEMRLSDKQLELDWYASLYLLALCAGNRRFAPGLYGNFNTVENSNWRGDYHLNYNYQAPFYAAVKANHVELTDCYMAPIAEYMPEAREHSRSLLGCRGVYFPTALMPRGTISSISQTKKWATQMLFLGQKSNAAYVAAVLMMRWYATLDEDYAREHIYPFLLEVGEFWESFLKKENGKYVIYDDAIHEIPYYKDDFNERKHRRDIHAKNCLLSLGLVRMVFRGLVDISSALRVDEAKRSKWNDIIENISEYPTFIRKLKRVFRYTEKGDRWHTENFLCLQHCYPAGQIGLESDAALLRIARSTFYSSSRWLDGNAANSVYPAAVRLGLDGEEIIKNLRRYFKLNRLPNGLIYQECGCLENVSIAANTLDEMCVLSHEGVLRFFKVWDKGIDCAFKNLLCDGAFSVSGSIEKGKIGEIGILSQKGGALTFENPFERCIVESDRQKFTTADRTVTLNTVCGERISIKGN